MSDKFIKDLAERRAKVLFTKEFFLTCTDSWYGDEELEFESHEVGINGRHPSPDEVDVYMDCMQKLKNEYQDKFYSVENAVCGYSSIINALRDVVENIEEFKKKYKDFECPDEMTLKLKQVGNYFVDAHNELLPLYNDRVKDLYKDEDVA